MPLEIYQIWYKKWWIIAAVIGGVLFLFGGYIRLFLLYRVRDLEKILNRQKKELAAKVSVIEQQSETLDHQKEELSEAMSNIATLHFIAGQIKPNSQWDEIIASVGKAIDQSIGIHAFEIAYRKKDDIKYRGYSNQEQGGLTYRKKIFDPKTSLTSYVIAYQKEIVINDFRKEHSQYVKKKASYHFQSMIFIPFRLANGQQAALCVYHTQKEQFERHDVLMLEVLADYLCLCAVNELE